MLADPGSPGPRDVFLSGKEVIARYGWARTNGYRMLSSTGFPKPIGGRYRLDRLMAWEDRVLDGELTGRPDPRPDAKSQQDAAYGTSTQPETPTLREPATTASRRTCDATTSVDLPPVQAPTRRRTRGTRRAA